MRHIAILSILLCLATTASAQHEVDSTFLAEIDSLITEAERSQVIKQVIREYEEKKLRREQSFDYSFVIPLCKGGYLAAREHSLMQHDGILASKSGVNKMDYAVGGLPLIATWAMKAAGVKSRSTTKRMAISNALTLALTAGIAKSVKTLANETRPDGTDNRSMPSGHSAIAFASASILAREYSDVSPWIPVAGYTTAIGTQYLRLRHNKHWTNDIHIGAGIGMLSANLGYWLTDRIMPHDGILTPPQVRLRDMQRVARFNNQPSGIAVISGSEFGNRTFTVADQPAKAQLSFTTGVDVSWFLNQIVALELMAHTTTGYAKPYCVTAPAEPYTADDMLLYHLNVGAKLSHPFALGQRASIRAFAGMRHIDAITFNSPSTPTLGMAAKNNLETGLGIGYEAIDKHHFATGFALDYIHTFSTTMSDRFCLSSTWKVLF